MSQPGTSCPSCQSQANDSRYSEPVSGLGRKIHDFVTSSDSESESEDDFEYIGGLPRVKGIT